MNHAPSKQGQNRVDAPSGKFQKGVIGNPGGRPLVTAHGKSTKSKADTVKPPAIMGRPSSYDPKWHIPKAQSLCALGATLEQIAEVFDIDVTTLWRWKTRYPDLCNALKIGAAPADDAVEMTLYRRALGYEVTETERRYEMTEVEDPQTGEIRVFRKLIGVKEKVREIPPDTTAMIFWLKNRRPEEWRESYHRISHEPEDVTSEQLARQLMFTFRQYAEEGGDPMNLLAKKTRSKRDE